MRLESQIVSKAREIALEVGTMKVYNEIPELDVDDVIYLTELIPEDIEPPENSYSYYLGNNIYLKFEFEYLDKKADDIFKSVIIINNIIMYTRRK